MTLKDFISDPDVYRCNEAREFAKEQGYNLRKMLSPSREGLGGRDHCYTNLWLLLFVIQKHINTRPGQTDWIKSREIYTEMCRQDIVHPYKHKQMPMSERMAIASKWLKAVGITNWSPDRVRSKKLPGLPDGFFTKKDFITLMKAGWKDKAYKAGVYLDRDYDPSYSVDNVRGCCAVGAVRIATNTLRNLTPVVSRLKDEVAIINASDNAGSKDAAIKAVGALPDEVFGG